MKMNPLLIAGLVLLTPLATLRAAGPRKASAQPNIVYRPSSLMQEPKEQT